MLCGSTINCYPSFSAGILKTCCLLLMHHSLFLVLSRFEFCPTLLPLSSARFSLFRFRSADWGFSLLQSQRKPQQFKAIVKAKTCTHVHHWLQVTSDNQKLNIMASKRQTRSSFNLKRLMLCCFMLYCVLLQFLQAGWAVVAFSVVDVC